MISLAALVAVLLSADPAADAARAAAAAEKAAQAAAVAAEAALKAAEAAARVSAVVPAKLSVPAAPAPQAAPAAAKPASPWTGSVGLGLISLTGNSRTVTFTTNALAERKSESWIESAKLYATYGQNRVNATETAPERTDTVAEAAGAQLRLDRRFADRYSAYILGAADTDHVKSVELRSTGELGASIVWVDAGGDSGWKTTLKTDLGFRIANEVRHQYYPRSGPADDATLYAPRAALAFKYALSKDVLFSQDAEIMPNVVGDSRVVVNSLSKISTRLSRSLAFGVAFTGAHDSLPAKPKVATDTSLALTLDVLL